MNNVKVKLKDIVTVKNGSTPSTANPNYYDGEIIWITPKDLSNQNSRYVWKGERTITNDGLSSCSSTLLPKGTVLMSSRAPIGLLSIAATELCTNQGFKNFIPNTNVINSEFLYYYLKTKIHDIEKLGSGTTFKEVSKSSIENFELTIPKDINDQYKISNILSSLDSKIELNNRINAELESMAKTIYDYWFVQFDFPDKNGKPYKSSGGKMVWNEELKREIPEGWEVKLLSDWIEKDKSGDWGKESEEGNYTERVHCIRGADINGLNGKGEVKSPVRYILPKNTHKILEPFDLIIEISGGSPTQSTGRLAFFIEETISRFDAPIICSNFCKAVTLKYQKSVFNFVFEWNNAYDNGVLFGFEGKTSGIKNLLFESFITSYKTAVPSFKLMENFYQNVYLLELIKQKLLKENSELASLRDWLLPMLMNGQVKVN